MTRWSFLNDAVVEWSLGVERDIDDVGFITKKKTDANSTKVCFIFQILTPL